MIALLLAVALVEGPPAGTPDPNAEPTPAAALAVPAVSNAFPRGPGRRELFDAEGLAPGRFAAFAGAGFPVLTAAIGYGLTDAWGLTLRVDSFYFKTAAVTLSGRRTLRHGGQSAMSLAVHLDVGGTYFDTPEVTDAGQGERWFTAESDLVVGGGAIVSTRGLWGSSLFFDATVQLTGDTETPPEALNPSPALTVGANGLLHGGFSLPLGEHVSLLALLGLDLHFKALNHSNQSLAMPYAALGLEFL